ncbi:MAG: hypothetical protein O2955_09900 [Planctomycetota bacterium]|nr:hypothetical protein [Planctomycetota bacterium]MDA1212823.1 hypothetical protein [Planctomycetota bacterium]
MSGLSNAGLPEDPARSSALPNSISGHSNHVSAACSEIDTVTPDVPVRWREFFGVFAILAVSDITLYRSYGYAGFAVFFAVAQLLFWLSSPERRSGRRLVIVSTLLFALSVKLLWCGSGLRVACGFTLILAFTMAMTGLTPHVIETIAFAIQAISSGFSGIRAHWCRIDGYAGHKPWSGWGTLIAPELVWLLRRQLLTLVIVKLPTDAHK